MRFSVMKLTILLLQTDNHLKLGSTAKISTKRILVALDCPSWQTEALSSFVTASESEIFWIGKNESQRVWEAADLAGSFIVYAWVSR